MNCTYCGTALPAGALFCGECGRAVTPEQSHADRRARADDAPPRSSAPRALIDRLVQPSAPTFDEVFDSSALDAVEKDPDAATAGSPSLSSVPASVPASLPASVPSSLPDPSLDPVASADPLASAPPLRCEHCGAELAPSDIFCPECGNVARSITDGFASRAPSTTSIPLPARSEPAASAVDASAPAASAPAGGPASSGDDRETAIIPPFGLDRPATPQNVPDDREIEHTRATAAKAGARFVLQFSTGETFTVQGTGLIGRNPQPEPGEYFDQLVRVLDASRSVSKTHLEYGQQDEMFWIRDRFSGNGTVFSEPGAPGLRCAPDKRYRIARGTRVEIGEQFFIVS